MGEATGHGSDDHRAQLTRVARGGLANLAGAAVTAVAGFALVIVVTNAVSSQVAGHFFAVTSLFVILLAVSTLGTDTGLVRFVQRFLSHGRADDIRTCVSVARRPVVLVSVALGAALVVGAAPLAGLLGLQGDSSVATVRALGATLPVAALGDFSLGGTRAFGHMRFTVVLDRIGRPLIQVAGVLLIAAAHGGLLGLTLAWVIPYVVTAVAGTWTLRALLRRHDTGGAARPERAAITREFWSFTWARSIAQVLQLALQRTDILLVAAMVSPSAAAAYTVATRFVPLGQFAANAIQQALQPRIAAMLSEHDLAGARQVFQVSTAWGVLATWPVYASVAAVAGAYLSVFGAEYRTDATMTVVVVMAAAMMVGSAFGTLDTVLLMAGRSTTSLANAGVALVTDLGLCVLLIPRWGIVGAAVAWAASVATRNLLGLWQVRRTVQLAPFGRAWVFATLASVVCFLLPLGLATALAAPAGVLGAVFVGGTVLYAAALVTGRRVLRLDLVVGALRPGARG